MEHFAVFEKIEKDLLEMKKENEYISRALCKTARLTDYSAHGNVWTSALQRAIDENEVIIIPERDEPYILDASVIIPSNRRIIAEGRARIVLAEGTKVLMLRNANVADGTHERIARGTQNENISIEGGIWEECHTRRGGYGRSGMFDAERSLFGVSTCFFFNNVDRLTLKNMTFRRTGGFAIQIGDARNVVVEGIRFEGCFADGVHINGGVENAYVKDIRGSVGDDLVALNMYDWLDSSVNFGPTRNVLCEDLALSEESPYKAIRLLPGVYKFDDGTKIDCSLTNAIFRRVSGIKTFKFYCQTPRYDKGCSPEPVEIGSGDNVLFDDIDIELDEPIDKLQPYLTADPITGAFAAFELGSNIENLFFRDIRLCLDRGRFPESHFLTVGPKSVRIGDTELFDPYFSSEVSNVYFENVSVNGERVDSLTPFVREIEFDALYPDMPSTAKGTVKSIISLDK